MIIKKTRQILGVDLYIGDTTKVSFSNWRGVGIAHVSPSYVHVYD